MNRNWADLSRRDALQHLTTLSGLGIGGGLLLAACDGSTDQNEATDPQKSSSSRAVEQISEIRREWERAENEGD